MMKRRLLVKTRNGDEEEWSDDEGGLCVFDSCWQYVIVNGKTLPPAAIFQVKILTYVETGKPANGRQALAYASSKCVEATTGYGHERAGCIFMEMRWRWRWRYI